MKLVSEAESGIQIEQEVVTIEREDRLGLAIVGLTIAEGKAILASLQRSVVTCNAFRFWAMRSGFDGVAQFAKTLSRDLQAVELAIETPWSNGPVEGHINRLKAIKRQMYGRAGFELLRARVLPWHVSRAS